MNRVSLVGRITKDPELRTSPNNVSFVSFTIAINRPIPAANGEKVADFINCVAFNKQAENLARFIKKGGQIGVEGRLQTRKFNAPDGSPRYATEVVCDNVYFLESRSSQTNQNEGSYNDYSSYETPYTPAKNNNQNRPSAPQQQQQPDEDDDVKKQYDISDDDLPF